MTDVFSQRPKISRRQQAHALFLAGSTLDEVIAKTGLKRATAGMYLWEARFIFAKRIKNDDMLK